MKYQFNYRTKTQINVLHKSPTHWCTNNSTVISQECCFLQWPVGSMYLLTPGMSEQCNCWFWWMGWVDDFSFARWFHVSVDIMEKSTILTVGSCGWDKLAPFNLPSWFHFPWICLHLEESILVDWVSQCLAFAKSVPHSTNLSTLWRSQFLWIGWANTFAFDWLVPHSTILPTLWRSCFLWMGQANTFTFVQSDPYSTILSALERSWLSWMGQAKTFVVSKLVPHSTNLSTLWRSQFSWIGQANVFAIAQLVPSSTNLLTPWRSQLFNWLFLWLGLADPFEFTQLVQIDVSQQTLICPHHRWLENLIVDSCGWDKPMPLPSPCWFHASTYAMEDSTIVGCPWSQSVCPKVLWLLKIKWYLHCARSQGMGGGRMEWWTLLVIVLSFHKKAILWEIPLIIMDILYEYVKIFH